MRQIGLRALPRPSRGLDFPPEAARADCLIQELPSGFRGPPESPAQRDIRAGVQSAARYVPRSDARVTQQYRLVA
jgi:hypothetical protein